jgi:hypothetical protein
MDESSDDLDTKINNINSNIEKDLETITEFYDILIEPNKSETDNDIISRINHMINNLKQYYIKKIKLLEIHYTEDELNIFSIEKLKEIVDNYDFYKSNTYGYGYINNKINLYSDKHLLNGCFFDSLMVALFNKKNYMIEKLLFTNYNTISFIEDININKTDKFYTNTIIDRVNILREEIIKMLKLMYDKISNCEEIQDINLDTSKINILHSEKYYKKYEEIKLKNDDNKYEYLKKKYGDLIPLNTYIRLLISDYCIHYNIIYPSGNSNSRINEFKPLIMDLNEPKEQEYINIIHVLYTIINIPSLCSYKNANDNKYDNLLPDNSLFFEYKCQNIRLIPDALKNGNIQEYKYYNLYIDTNDGAGHITIKKDIINLVEDLENYIDKVPFLFIIIDRSELYMNHEVNIKEKITFNNYSLYLNSIITHSGGINGHNRCIFERNKKWYMYNNTDNPTVKHIANNFDDLFKYEGPENEQDYVRKKAIGLFYT